MIYRYKVYFIPHQTKNLWDTHTLGCIYIYWLIDVLIVCSILPFFRERKESVPRVARYVVGKKAFFFSNTQKEKVYFLKNKRQQKREERVSEVWFLLFFQRERAIARRESIISSLYNKPNFFSLISEINGEREKIIRKFGAESKGNMAHIARVFIKGIFIMAEVNFWLYFCMIKKELSDIKLFSSLWN